MKYVVIGALLMASTLGGCSSHQHHEEHAKASSDTSKSIEDYFNDTDAKKEALKRTEDFEYTLSYATLHSAGAALATEGYIHTLSYNDERKGDTPSAKHVGGRDLHQGMKKTVLENEGLSLELARVQKSLVNAEKEKAKLEEVKETLGVQLVTAQEAIRTKNEELELQKQTISQYEEKANAEKEEYDRVKAAYTKWCDYAEDMTDADWQVVRQNGYADGIPKTFDDCSPPSS